MSRIKDLYIKKDLPPRFNQIGIALLVIGVIGGTAGYFIDPVRSSFGYLTSYMFLLSIGVGSLFLIALEYIAGADWSVPFRRIPEFLASLLPLLFILVIPLLLSMHNLFHWTHNEAVANDKILQGKAPYLNVTFFIIRVFVVLLVWNLFYFLLRRNSLLQDNLSDSRLTKKNIVMSGIFMPLFAITITITAIDWMMSLEPHWFSTIFGVYFFSGAVWSSIALITLFAIHLYENKYLHLKINTDHFYSLGTLLFAFTCFWGYIAFSQYMLIWYADLPEENFWFFHRWDGGWIAVSIILIISHFIVPFFALLSYKAKTDPVRLKFMSVWILISHLIDLYWLILPNMYNVSGGYYFSWVDFAFLSAAAGIIMIIFNRNSKKYNLVPVGDPKLQRGLSFSLHRREVITNE
jgi:hypothetical protein